MTKKSTLEEFIFKACNLHKDRYNYSLVNYINTNIKVEIICPIHGIFWQAPSKHCVGQGCVECGIALNSSKLRKPFDLFVKEANEIHNNKYKYIEETYVSAAIKTALICDIHGTFYITPNSHLYGRGCNKCGIISRNNKRSFSKEMFLELAIQKFGSKFDYSQIEFTKMTGNKIKIICPEHGEFYQIPYSHIITKYGCEKCSANVRSIPLKLTKEDFIRRAEGVHGSKFNYENIDFIDFSSKIKLICKKHGEFSIFPYSHIKMDAGCPKCSRTYSKIENEWIKSLGELINHEKTYINIDGKRFHPDGYGTTDHPTIYEFLGDYWHGNPVKFNLNDINKTNKKSFQELYNKNIERFTIFTNAGFDVKYVWETDFKNGLLFSGDISMPIRQN